MLNTDYKTIDILDLICQARKLGIETSFPLNAYCVLTHIESGKFMEIASIVPGRIYLAHEYLEALLHLSKRIK